MTIGARVKLAPNPHAAGPGAGYGGVGTIVSAGAFYGRGARGIPADARVVRWDDGIVSRHLVEALIVAP